MISECYSVYDGAVKAFLPPFQTRSRGEAIRSFSEACNDEKHQFNRHGADYTLFYLGVFDDASGVYSPEPTPARVIGALECLKEDDLFPAGKRLPM